jgi:hypothetical protein
VRHLGELVDDRRVELRDPVTQRVDPQRRDPIQVTTPIDVDQLITMWPNLFLPDRVKKAWAAWLQERRGIRL